MSVSLYGSGNTVIQVVQASNSTSASTTGSTYVASNLTASITPQSTNSKILILINAPIAITQLSAAAYAMGLQLNRNSTAVFTDNAVGDSLYNGEYGNYIGTWKQRTPLIYLDSPSTTSSTTYTLYFAAYQGTAFVSNSSAIANITLLEISGA